MSRRIYIPFLQQQSLDKFRRSQWYFAIVKFTESSVSFLTADFIPYYADIVLFFVIIRNHSKYISNFSLIPIMPVP